jgi:hypothetical protein
MTRPTTKPTNQGAPHDELLVIGFDGDEFVFSDADATESNSHGAGFGRLFFADDRLSTANGAADLPVGLCGAHARGDKRYQVLTLRPI